MARRKRHERDVDKERLWRSILERQQSSGLSVRAFCRGEALSEPTFHWWKRTIRQRDADRRSQAWAESSAAEAATAARTLNRPPREAFVPVHVIGPPEASVAAPIEIVGPGGYAVRVSSGCEAEVLQCVLRVLHTLTAEIAIAECAVPTEGSSC